jgi:hypothetical protein
MLSSVQVESGQERREVGNEVINKIQHTVERFKNRLTSDDLRLSERYIKAELKVLVACSFVGVSGDVHDFVALFQRHRGFGPSDLPSRLDNDAPLFDRSCGRKYKPMLIPTVKIVDIPQCVVTSEVWLYNRDHLFCTWHDCVYSSLANCRCVLLGSLADREKGAPVGLTSASFDESPSKMIQGASKVMDRIPEHQRDVIGDWLDAADVKSYVANLRLVIDSERIRLRIAEGTNSNIQIADVLFGPFNL